MSNGIDSEVWTSLFQGSRQRGVTLILSNLLKQWFPHKLEVHLLKEEGNRLAEMGKFAMAIEKYTKAMTIGELLVL